MNRYKAIREKYHTIGKKCWTFTNTIVWFLSKDLPNLGCKSPNYKNHTKFDQTILCIPAGLHLAIYFKQVFLLIIYNIQVENIQITAE